MAELSSVLKGRVLVVGDPKLSAPKLELLAARGFFCAAADSLDTALTLARDLQPEAILIASGGPRECEVLVRLRKEEAFRHLPVIADLTGDPTGSLRKIGFQFDDRIYTDDELPGRLEATLRAKRLVEQEARVQLRMEMLLEITQAATSSLELEEILRIAVAKIARVIAADRCSVVLVEGSAARRAQVVASKENLEGKSLPLDLARYPELRRAIETRQSVYVEDATRDPLMKDVHQYIAPIGVKSILVQPLICQEDLLGALFLRLSRTDGFFGREEQEFARAVAAALANSVRNAQLHSALKRKREELESAYVDRYRELTDANRRLKDLNRLKDEIIAICSHDVRAPLQVLLGHGRLLLDSGLPSAQESSVQAIVRQGKKILELVESLLERGKGEQARLSIEPIHLDVAELSKETAVELEILAAARSVSLRAETPESLMVIGDEVKLREVLQNLVTNAINHTPPGGEVVVRSQRLKRPDGDAAHISIQDNGPGIPSDQLRLVFDRYRHGPGGTGLGLAICKEFVELHGGEIWAESPGRRGTKFIFTLPLAKSLETEGGVPAPAPTTAKEVARVLVVEDEPEVAAVVSEILRSRFKVEVARDGAEGVAKARAMHPDLIVMDVFLPKLDGLDAAVALKSSSDTANIPVILLSAHQGVADKVRALNLGAVDYLGKPFQALELLSRAERAIQLSAAELRVRKREGLLREIGSDPRTGLFDRAGLLARLEQEVMRSRRYQRPLSLAVLIPEKPLANGIEQCAALIRGRLRAPDLVGHLGNGSFALVLPESTLDAAQGICSRICPDLHQATGVAYRTSAADMYPPGTSAETALDQLLGNSNP